MRVRAAMLAMVILGAAGQVMAAEEWRSRYVVVLAGEMESGEAEALIGVYGGSRDPEQPEGGGGELVVRMSLARAEMLRHDPRVVSVVEQRLHLSPHPTGSGSMTLGAYAYDGAGNIKRLGQEQSPQEQYVYDALGRLVSATAGMANTQTYQYDAFGNRGTVTRSGSPCTGGSSCELSGTYVPGTNHLNTANGGEYDAAGNAIAYGGNRYVYDATGMMMRSLVGTQDRQYLYTAGDERIAVYDGTTNWRWTARGADGKVLREFTSTNNGSSYGTLNRKWLKDYVWRDGALLATDSLTASGTVVSHHYHLDHLGTPRLVTNGAGAKVATHTYYAFGAELQTTPESPETVMKFTGHERDLTGSSNALDYMHARYYRALDGRFLSVDPGRDWDPRNPQSWNMYSYARNNPINRRDPTGRYVCSGTRDECKAYEASLSIVRAAATEATRQKLEGADKLNKIVKLYGKLGEKNGVGVTFGATKLNQRMETTVSANGNVSIAVNRQIFGQDLAARQYVDIATGVAHEGDHGLAGREHPELRNTNSRSILMQQEISAYRAGGYIYQSLGFSDTHRAIWQVDGGWTPLLEHFAKQSVDAECADRGGCSP